MSKWPPTADELWAAVPDSHVSLYGVHLWSELHSNIPHFGDLDEEEQHELLSLVRWLDTVAAQTKNYIRNSPWTEPERRFFAPPPAACKNERSYTAWQADHTDQLCIDAARRARIAIFEGRWTAAVSAAFEAGQHSRARYAEIGWKVRGTLPRKGSRKAKCQKLDQRDEEIVREANTIRAEKPGLSDKRVAELLVKKHAGDPTYPKSHRRICQIWCRHESWKPKPCTSNNRSSADCTIESNK